MWFADKAKSQGHFFSQKGDELKSTKDAEKIIGMLLARDQESDDDQEIIVLATPLGEPGPGVAMPIKKKWVIGNLGRFGGEYTVVAQVERLIGPDESLPALRLTHDVAATPLEINTLKSALTEFKGAAEEFGLDLADAATVDGPALWLEPIAIFR